MDKEDATLLALIAGIVSAGCGMVVLILCIIPGLIYILFNWCLPVLGFSYPLTLFQCCIAAIVLAVSKVLIFAGIHRK